MPSESSIFGLLAEFETAADALQAVRTTHAAGYRRIEAYSPFPVEGLPEAVGFRRTRLPLVFFVGGLLGTLAGYFMCWYANVVSYPWNTGGRPPNSWPLFITITIDTGIGVSFLFGLAGLLLLNRQPQPYHPLFNVPAFARVTRDRFFLCIETVDARFNLEATRAFLVSLNPLAIHEVPW